MPTPTPKQINIGCNTIILKNDKILLGKRKNCYGAGTWGLPGGHLEFGENLVDAAKREIREEIGADIDSLEFLSLVDSPRPDENDHYVQVTFVAKNVDIEPKLMEPDSCDGWDYFALDSLPEIFPPHRKILDSYINRELYVH